MRRGLALLLALMAVTPVVAPVVAPVRAEPLAFVETVVQGPEGQDASRPAWPVVARLSGPTDRYDHDVLGGLPPWSVLEVRALACGACRHVLRAPRLSCRIIWCSRMSPRACGM